jgi:oxygen-dependent protoporphyrinogen oxidase
VTRAPVVVLGAGFAGLVAGVELRRLGVDVVVLEAADAIGGLATSHRVDGVTFDTGAHFVTNRLATAIGVMDQCETAADYRESVWRSSTNSSYPLGLMRSPRYATSAVAARVRPGPTAVTAADRFRQEYGRALADEIALPLLEAWSGLPADQLDPSVLDKIPGGIASTVALTLARRVTHRPIAIGYCGEAPQSANVWHVYPRRGLDVFVRRLADELGDRVVLSTPVESIDVSDGRVTNVRAGGRDFPAAAVVTTLPAPLLPRLLADPAVAPLAQLRFRAMVFLQLRVRGRGLLPAPVTWTPESAFPFFRVTEAPMAMPWLAPLDQTVLTVDIGAQVGDATWETDPTVLAETCLDALGAIVPDIRRRHIGTYSTKTALAYPVFALATEAARRRVSTHDIRGLVSAGRNAEFGHLLMEDVYWRTLRTTRALAHGLAG